MASKLGQRDKELLNAHITKRVGQKPYEDGLWGSQGNRDFAYLEIYDSQNNLIEFKNLSLAEFSVNTNNNIEFYPGKHITELGFDSGTFKVKYNFLRKLAGDDASVLVRTKAGLEGDIYNNLSNIYITDDGKVYIGTEEQFRDSGNTGEQLAIEDLKYQIDEISPSRKEVRLKAKNINGDYILDFVDIQTPINLVQIDSVIDFIGTDLNDSNALTISPDTGGFLFTQKMVDGTVTIPNVFKVNEIQIAARTETNFIKNPSGELYDTDSFGDPLNLKNKYEWDASLHADAISVKNWSSGFNGHGSGTAEGTAAVGYHAKWVIGEGMTGGTAMKFPDQNDMFTDLDIWPNNIPHRWLGIRQDMSNLQGQGVTWGDIVNVSLNVKSTVAGKGVQVSLRYADEMLAEDDPTPLRPIGYFDPSSPDPTETMPINPPVGYTANTNGNATAIEAQPPETLIDILSIYNLTFADLSVGDTTTYWGGVGAWIITDVILEDITMEFEWSPNLGSEYTLEGTLSIGGQWEWDGSAWVIQGQANSPSPPVGSVNPLEWPDAVNSHPYQLEGQGSPVFRRDTVRGLNSGWQTGTQTGDNGILIKDDLVWITEWEYTSNYSKIQLHAFDDYFIGTRDVILDNGSTLYEDIFANGFIQSITRVAEGSNDGIRNGWYLIFYNNGDIDENNGESSFESNRYFYIKTYVGVQTRQGLQVQLLKDVDSAFNDAVIDNNNQMEWSFKHMNQSGQLKYYAFVGDKYWRLKDFYAGDLTFGFDSGYPQNRSSGFPGLPSQPEVMFPKRDWSRYTTIIGDQIYRFKSSAGNGIEVQSSLNSKFYQVGEQGTNGDELVMGSRNLSATNYNSDAIYDDGSSEFTFDPNPLKTGFTTADFEDYPVGSNSAGNGLWTWDGQQWNSTGLTPPRFHYTSPSITARQALPTIAGEWQKFDLEIEIPDDWKLAQKWYLYIYGHASKGGPVGVHGVTWVDDLFMDFTLKDQSITQDVFKPFTAQIASVSADGKVIIVSRNFKQNAIDIGVDDEDPETAYYDVSNPGTFPAFQVSYLNLNPMDLRTYLKFDNNLFLTTNFKQDKISVESYPHSVVYKLYEPLPNDFEKFDECIIVKEMANPLEETIKIIDFVPEEMGKLVLKSPDLKNVESPIQARTTDFKNETDILTDDTIISTELRNEFLSQSIDSVELNTDYSRYKNFVNFSSAEKRIRNFKYKLELIEDYRTISSSYVGVSGSSSDLNKWNVKIHDIKNNLDSFEKYMYFESSSYVSSSLGIFHDNSWPVADGSGTLNSPYILTHTTSSQATTWFSNAMISSSNYDAENLNKLSNLLPEYIKEDSKNQVYLDFTDMVAQHFDNIWIYINSITDTFDRREKLTEGISKDLLGSVAKSLGWNLNDGKDLVPLTKFALGKEVTGSAYSDYSAVSERDVSREIWSRIINNMPFFLKNKGTVRALKGLINVYGIPSTILRVKEYGGPDVPDNETPQYEITRKFTKALDFKSSQYVKTAWSDDSSTSRKPDTVEFRFRAATGSDQILVQKSDDNNQDWFIRLKDNDSTDNYGFVSFMLSGSQVGAALGQYKEVSSSALPIYDGDFYSVMVRRMSGSTDTKISQSYELNVGKYDSSRSKIHLYSTTTMDVTQAASSSFSNAWTGSGDVYIGGSADIANVGVQFSGSIMEYRHWTEILNTGSFKNHVGNPKAYDGNTVSSSYNNLVLRYSFDDNKDLSSDTEGIRDVSSNQTTTYSGSHSGFSGNFFRSVVDELKSFIPSIGALRRTTNKIRLESNSIKPGQNLQPNRRATVSVYDSAPTDSNKVGIFFAPTDVINNDIINSVANLNFDNYLGDPRDKSELNYRGLDYVADNYWKKYSSPNNFWDYIRLIKYYDQSLYPQLRKMIPARVKADIGLLIEPNIFERPKVIMGRDPDIRIPYYSSSIDIGNAVDGLIQITASYNHDRNVVRSFNAYDADIKIYSYETGSMMSSSGAYLLYEATSSEARDRFLERSLWQRLSRGDKYYSNVTMSFGDTISGSREVLQPVVSGSRIYGRNQKLMSFYSSSLSASLEIAHSSSYYNVDLDNLVEHNTALFNRTYGGVKNVVKTSADRKSPVEVIITAPTKLVTAKAGDSTLTTGEGMVPDFKEADDREDERDILHLKRKKKKLRGLKGLREAKLLEEDVVETDADRKKELRKKWQAEGRPKKKTKRKAGTAKPKKPFVEDVKVKQTKGTERKETTTRQKRIEKPVYKKKVTPPAKNYGKGKK